MTKLEEIEDDVKSLQRKIQQGIVDLDNLQKELEKKSEIYYEINPDYIKATCFSCYATGYYKAEDGSKKVCPICKGNQWYWVKKWDPKMMKQK